MNQFPEISAGSVLAALFGAKVDLERLGVKMAIPCDAVTELPAEYHKHQCPKCGDIWAHHDALPALVDSEEQCNSAHACPKCGALQLYKFGFEPDDLKYREPVAVSPDGARSWK